MLRNLLLRGSGKRTGALGVPAVGVSLSATDRAALGHFPRAPLPPVATSAVRGWEFPAHLDNPNCAWLQALKHVYAQRITFPASLSPQAGQLLHAIVLNVQPRVVIETGTFLGISTIWIAAALELAGDAGGARTLHCIDDFRPIKKGRWRSEEMLGGREQKVREHIGMAGLLHRVVIHDADSAAGIAAVGAALAAERGEKGQGDTGTGRQGEQENGGGGGGVGGGGVQLAFLDADHSPRGVRREFEQLEGLLDTGGYIILHDIYPEMCNWRGPRELLDHVHEFSRGRYEHVDLYLAPANFGLGVMRRVG